MKVIGKSLVFACAFFGLAGTARAADGILIVMKTAPEGGAAQTHLVQIDGRRMRAEATGERGEKQIAVFDGTKKVMMLIDDQRKTYVEVAEAELEARASQMSGMMAQMAQMQEQMKQRMASMTPEQRAQMEEAMGRGMAMSGAPAAAKIQYTKTGTGTVGKWTCDKYEGTSGGQKVSEVCAADPKALGFTAADFEVSRELVAFFKKIMPPGAGGAQMFSIGTAADQGFSGVPVRTVTSPGGRQVTTEITEVSRQAIPDSVFQAPAGYQKTSMMGGRGRGRQ
jgi:uncharacterized protein DUF4412